MPKSETKSAKEYSPDRLVTLASRRVSETGTK